MLTVYLLVWKIKYKSTKVQNRVQSSCLVLYIGYVSFRVPSRDLSGYGVFNVIRCRDVIVGLIPGSAEMSIPGVRPTDYRINECNVIVRGLVAETHHYLKPLFLCISY